MAAAAVRARGGGAGGARRPFAPVAVSPPPSRAVNRMVQDYGAVETQAPAASFARRGWRVAKCGGGETARETVLGGAKKCGSGSSPAPASPKKTPAATARGASRKASRRRVVGSCASKKRPTTPPAAPAAAEAEAVAADDAPRAQALDFTEEWADKVRAELSSPYGGYGDAGRGGHRQEPRGGEDAAASIRRTMRSVALEEAMASLPEPGEGRVRYLVDTFERLLLLAAAGCGGGPEARSGRRKNEASAATATTTTASSPATSPRAEEIDVSYPSIASSSDVSFPAGVACILDASDRTRITRARGQRRRRAYNSIGSSERSWSRKVTRVTNQHPFNLRTEARGKAKEENFVQRLRKMQMEEERLRNPLAQGLPYTTDEPENPVKPPTKEPTEPMDVLLHSDVRAVGRAKFDHQVSERSSFLEEVKLARERQKKMDEEIEVKQLRKELVPRAHPMPDFTRPFVPKRSVKPHTIPREPRFHPRLARHTSKA